MFYVQFLVRSMDLWGSRLLFTPSSFQALQLVAFKRAGFLGSTMRLAFLLHLQNLRSGVGGRGFKKVPGVTSWTSVIS